MGPDELIAEGERLARPCLLLSDQQDSGSYTGIWGGEGVLRPSAGPWKHWLTIECGWLSKQGLPLTGLISVYANEDDCTTGQVVHEGTARLPKKPTNPASVYGRKARLNRVRWAGHPDARGSIALYGREGMSFPPIEAVFKYGGSAVKRWLRSLGLPKREQWDPYFQARGSVHVYDEEYRKRCPMFDSQLRIAAVLGGWHTEWPDGDWVQHTRKQLVLWTLWNSEPWVEVWFTKEGSFEVKQRIT
jgi:hypothetical protein